MPNDINKQTLINLLIDSPLREPIKINLIDIVNNTSDPDLPKIFPTITKELEIFQKATERRMKLADETIQKLGGNATPSNDLPTTETQSNPVVAPPTPPLENATVPTPPAPPILPTPTPPQPTQTPIMNTPPLSVPPLDLPPMPQVPSPSEQPAPAVVESTLPTPPAAVTASPNPAPAQDSSALPNLQPLGNTSNPSNDEDALAEIQKELESLKSGITQDANPTSPTQPQV